MNQDAGWGGQSVRPKVGELGFASVGAQLLLVSFTSCLPENGGAKEVRLRGIYTTVRDAGGTVFQPLLANWKCAFAFEVESEWCCNLVRERFNNFQ